MALVYETPNRSPHARMVQVITPYMGQKAEILGMMRKRGLMGVSVDTVDSYQGMERDIVMVSTVRSNSAGAVGFLKCAPLFFACPLHRALRRQDDKRSGVRARDGGGRPSLLGLLSG